MGDLVVVPLGLREAVVECARFMSRPGEDLTRTARRVRALRTLLGIRTRSTRPGLRGIRVDDWLGPPHVVDAFGTVLEFCPLLRSGALTAAFRAANDPDYPEALRAAMRLGGPDAVRVLVDGPAPTPGD